MDAFFFPNISQVVLFLHAYPLKIFTFHVFILQQTLLVNPLISSIGNYSLSDLRRQYKKYIHKRPKHILL